MSTTTSSAADQTSAGLAREPALRRYFDAAMARFAARADVGIVVSGSLASGAVDRWSDLDIELVVATRAEVADTVAWMREQVRGLGPLLAEFPATHIGLPDLWIYFFADPTGVIKVDVLVMDRAMFVEFPDARIVADPGGRLADVRATSKPAGWPAPDFADLHAKLTGWLWYTATKIERGELFEAADSLSVMRARALLPCLALVEDLPAEGYRRIEQRLSAPRLERLRATHPAALERGPLYTALLALGRLFADVQDDVMRRLGRDHRRADLHAMLAIVERLAR